jgi:hypothetical protein
MIATWSSEDILLTTFLLVAASAAAGPTIFDRSVDRVARQ